MNVYSDLNQNIYSSIIFDFRKMKKKKRDNKFNDKNILFKKSILKLREFWLSSLISITRSS